MTRHWLTAAFLVVSFISAVPLRGSDDDAKALLREARNEYKEKDGVRKRILTDAFAKYLPQGLAQRPKRGFGVPLASWFRNEWRELLRERLLDGVCVKERIFNQPELEHILKAHSCGRADYSYFLFSALVLELFLKE